MILGVTSGAGKSTVTALLCRHFALQGARTSPFKAQNLSLNSFVTAGGEEIGVSQAYQAWACGTEPRWSMNPVLLKPKAPGSMQIILRGRPFRDLTRGADDPRPQLMEAIREGYAEIARTSDVIVLEGAGGAAEVNLTDRDVANFSMAEMVQAPVVLVGDIDRGGVFAGLYGTFALLPERHRRLVKGFLINRFRGDPSILGEGIDKLEELTGVPCLGVLPMTRRRLPAEDSLDLGRDRGEVRGCEDMRSEWLSALDELYDMSKRHLDYAAVERIALNRA